MEPPVTRGHYSAGDRFAAILPSVTARGLASRRRLGLGGTRSPGMPQRLELGLRHIAVEHRERQASETEPTGPRVARDQLMRYQTIVADAELSLHPAVFVHLGIQRARAQRRELARRPFQIE